MSFYSAQLDREGNVMAVVESKGKIEGKRIIQLDGYDISLLNSKYEFDTIKREPSFRKPFKPKIRSKPGVLVELSKGKS